MSVLLGKVSIKLSRIMGNRGSDVGGRTALKFSPKIFSRLAKNIDEVIIVTGTNGKSTVTNIVAGVLEAIEPATISNKTGANMYTGVLNTMIENAKIFGKKPIKYAVFEVDEGNVPKVLAEFDKSHLVITNFFRDQLDRYSEIDLIINKIKEGIDKDKVDLLINADDPFCLRFNDFNYTSYGMHNDIDIFTPDKITDSKYCPECGEELQYETNFYSQLGHFNCECGFTRPKPEYEAEKIGNQELVVNKQCYHHNLLGSYNAYNILAAIAILKKIGISDEDIQAGLDLYHSADGRMQVFNFNDKKTYLNLVKNPAGMNRSLAEVKNLGVDSICFIVNDYEGDGIDVSWLWDANFELLLASDVKKFYACGTRAYEVALRLKNMGVSPNKIMVNPMFVTLANLIIKDNSLVCASYTALNETKNILLQKEGA